MSGIFVDKEKVWSSMFTSTVNRQVTSSQASQVARFGSVTSCRILGLFVFLFQRLQKGVQLNANSIVTSR